MHGTLNHRLVWSVVPTAATLGATLMSNGRASA